MLTADLVRARLRNGRLTPVYLRGKQVERFLPIAQMLVEVFENALGKSADELDNELKDIAANERDRSRVAGFIKLLKDRCEFQAPGSQAESLRSLVFSRATEVRSALALRESFDREKVIGDCAETSNLSPEQLEGELFGDLPGAQILERFRPITPLGLVQRYNLALAQGLLLRATRVVIELTPSEAPRYRALFRALKFRRLMHQVEGDADQGYRFVVDGPMSLFEATQRYGLQLAMLLPVLVAGDGWRLEADVIWGAQRTRAVFQLSEREQLVSEHRGASPELEEVATLEKTFARLRCGWSVQKEARIFDIKGKGVFVPDLVFEHQETGRRVYLEAFGYWSREAVFQRVELLEQAFEEGVVLAVSKRLRVSEQIADDGFPGRILVYTQSIPAPSVRRLLDEILANPRTGGEPPTC